MDFVLLLALICVWKGAVLFASRRRPFWLIIYDHCSPPMWTFVRDIASSVLPLNALAVTVYIPACVYCLVMDCPGSLLIRILLPKSR